MTGETIFPETTAALRKITWSLRVLLCEKLMQWSMAVMPDDYTPALIETTIEETIAHLGRKGSQ